MHSRPIISVKFILLIFLIALIPSVHLTLACTEIAEIRRMARPEVIQKTVRALKERDPQIIIIGEQHFQHYFWKMENMLRYFTDLFPDLNCLLIESPEDTRPEEVDEALAGQENRIFPNPLLLGFAEIFRAGQELGLTPIPVDADHEWNQKNKPSGHSLNASFFDWARYRDGRMIANANSAFETGTCQRAIFLIGKAHLYSIPRHTYQCLGERIKSEARLTSVIIDLVYDDEFVNSRTCKERYVDNSSFFIAKDEIPPSVYRRIESKGDVPSLDFALYLSPMHTFQALKWAQALEPKPISDQELQEPD